MALILNLSLTNIKHITLLPLLYLKLLPPIHLTLLPITILASLILLLISSTPQKIYKDNQETLILKWLSLQPHKQHHTTLTTKPKFHFSSVLNCNNCNTNFKKFCLTISSNTEPTTYNQAYKHDCWLQVCNQNYKLFNLPKPKP